MQKKRKRKRPRRTKHVGLSHIVQVNGGIHSFCNVNNTHKHTHRIGRDRSESLVMLEKFLQERPARHEVEARFKIGDYERNRNNK